MSLYLVDGGVEVLYASHPVPAAAAGEVQAGAVFDVPVAEWTGAYVVRVDDDGSGASSLEECDEGDNEFVGTVEVCP